MGFTIWLSLVHLTILSPGGGTDCTGHPNQMNLNQEGFPLRNGATAAREEHCHVTVRWRMLTAILCVVLVIITAGWGDTDTSRGKACPATHPTHLDSRVRQPQDWVVHLNTTPVLRTHTTSIQHVFAKCLLHDRHRVRSWIMNYFHFISKDNWVYGEPSDIF